MAGGLNSHGRPWKQRVSSRAKETQVTAHGLIAEGCRGILGIHEGVRGGRSGWSESALGDGYFIRSPLGRIEERIGSGWVSTPSAPSALSSPSALSTPKFTSLHSGASAAPRRPVADLPLCFADGWHSAVNPVVPVELRATSGLPIKPECSKFLSRDDLALVNSEGYERAAIFPCDLHLTSSGLRN